MEHRSPATTATCSIQADSRTQETLRSNNQTRFLPQCFTFLLQICSVFIQTFGTCVTVSFLFIGQQIDASKPRQCLVQSGPTQMEEESFNFTPCCPRFSTLSFSFDFPSFTPSSQTKWLYLDLHNEKPFATDVENTRRDGDETPSRQDDSTVSTAGGLTGDFAQCQRSD